MTIITATATKPTAESKLGIAFSRASVEAPLVVKMIRPDGLFAATDLKEGMLVDKVMGKSMMFATPKDAADALRLAEAGDVTIEAMAMIGAITKTDKSQKLGISLKNSTTAPGIFVSKIGEDGLFAKSELTPGHKVLFINDVPCPPTTKEAITLIKEAESELKIIAVPTDIAPPAPAPMEEDVEEEKPDAPEEDAEEKKEDEPAESETQDKEIVDAGETKQEGGIMDVFKACIC